MQKILHSKPSLDALSLRSDVTSSMKIISLQKPSSKNHLLQTDGRQYSRDTLNSVGRKQSGPVKQRWKKNKGKQRTTKKQAHTNKTGKKGTGSTHLGGFEDFAEAAHLHAHL